MNLSSRVQRIEPSATMTMTAKAAAMRERGETIISLSAGEPDFATPEHIKAAAIEAINANQTRYTNVDGTTRLKQAVVKKFRQQNGLSFDLDSIVVSNGAKHSIFNAMAALLDPDDEVIVPAPFWVSYPQMSRLLDARPIIVPCSATNRFLLTPDALRSALSDRSRILLLNSPSNPTGQVYSREELASLADVVSDYPNLVVICDDIYEHIYFGDKTFPSLLNAAPNLRQQVVTINGVSKGYAMTGWRIGYAAAPVPIANAMRKIQSQSTTSPCSVSQAAAVAALEGDQQCIIKMRDAYRERHDFLQPALDALPGFRCMGADGAFYLLPDVTQLLQITGLNHDHDLATRLLEEAGVALVPGSAFGAPGHLRFSYAAGLETLQRAVSRIRCWIDNSLQDNKHNGAT